MNVKKVLSLILLLYSCAGNAQTKIFINDQEMQDYKNNQAYYFDSHNKYIGAGMSIDAIYTIVKFDSVILNKESKSVQIKGVTYETLIDNALRSNGVQIFVAVPKHKHLKIIKYCGYSSEKGKDAKEDGEFDVTFKLRKNIRLYFNGGDSFYLLEYDLAKILKEGKK